MDAVYTLQSGQGLNKSKFCRYIGKKIQKTSNKFGIKTKTNKVYCLDDAAIDVIYGLMAGKRVQPKKTHRVFRVLRNEHISDMKKSVFLYCLRKELELYAKLRKLKFEFINYSGLKLKIKEMLDSLEEKHKEIKYSVVKAQLQ